jgi:uncharacterized integral membrane protein
LKFLQELLVGAAIVSLVLFTPLWAPQLIFARTCWVRPKGGIVPAGVQLSDIMILIAQLAVGNATVSLLRQQYEYSPSVYAMLAIAVNGFVILMFAKCNRFMRERDIQARYARVLVQALFYPAAIFGIGLLVELAFILSLFETGSVDPFTPLSAAVTLMGTGFAMFLLRLGFQQLVTSDRTIDHLEVANNGGHDEEGSKVAND